MPTGVFLAGSFSIRRANAGRELQCSEASSGTGSHRSACSAKARCLASAPAMPGAAGQVATQSTAAPCVLCVCGAVCGFCRLLSPALPSSSSTHLELTQHHWCITEPSQQCRCAKKLIGRRRRKQVLMQQHSCAASSAGPLGKLSGTVPHTRSMLGSFPTKKPRGVAQGWSGQKAL